MTMAMKVMDAGLREDFGFQHLAWIYSGRRGVHWGGFCRGGGGVFCGVVGGGGGGRGNDARGAVASYFEVSCSLFVIWSDYSSGIVAQ